MMRFVIAALVALALSGPANAEDWRGCLDDLRTYEGLTEPVNRFTYLFTVSKFADAEDPDEVKQEAMSALSDAEYALRQAIDQMQAAIESYCKLIID